MAVPQIGSVANLSDAGLLVVQGRAFSPMCRVVWSQTGSESTPQRPALAMRNLLLLPHAPGQYEDARGFVVSENGDESREFRVPACGPGPVHDLILGRGVARPFTMAIIANGFYKDRGRIRRDQMLQVPEYFGQRVSEILLDIYQRPTPTPLAVPRIRRGTTIVVVFDRSLLQCAPDDVPERCVFCRVVDHQGRRAIQASRTRVQSFLEMKGVAADVAILLSMAPTAQPTGWFGTDNYARGGVPFTFDDFSRVHCYYSSLPGVVAFSRRNIRNYEVRHELAHALSSYNSGQVLDEYDLTPPFPDPECPEVFAVNKKMELTEQHFATYNDISYAAEQVRVRGGTVFVPSVRRGKFCLMHRLQGDPVEDALTGRFLCDRLLARLERPF